MWERFSDIHALLDWAAKCILERLYAPPEVLSRDKQIRQRHAQGESQKALAEEFGLTPTRVWQIVRHTR